MPAARTTRQGNNSYLCHTKVRNMWQTLLLSAIILLLCFVFLAIRVICVKNGRFPKTHVSQNAALRAKGITCVQQMDLDERCRTGLYPTSRHRGGNDSVAAIRDGNHEDTKNDSTNI